MQSRIKVLIVSRFWTRDQVFPGLKSDEFQKISDSIVIVSFFPGRK